MTRMSSLFVASALAVLPIGAFAQPTAAPAKAAAPTSITTATPATTSPVVAGKASDATVTQPAKGDLKAPVHGAKTEVHGMQSHDAKSYTTSGTMPAKTSVPAKS
jgi:hypothetical protein